MTGTKPLTALPIWEQKTNSIKAGRKDWAGIAESAAASAPYLGKLISKWPEITTSLSNALPEDILKTILSDMKLLASGDLLYRLRTAKQKVHLLTALCDLGGVWDWEQVTEVLSHFADTCMRLLIETTASEMEFKPCAKRGPVPGLFVMALGKYGARELNYSSDIDLIVFYDPDALVMPPTLKNANRAERILVRFVRKVMRGFDEITKDGYVFRTDLRLRPDPRANTVAVSTLTAERYYETLGQNWERAAMIKARFCGGDKCAADEFSENVLKPFIWRRSLDYAAIADIHSIKRQIQAGLHANDLCVPGHDIKLGIGGIREIEFFTSIQQLILGGRQKALRTPRTVDALQALANGGYVDGGIVDKLKCDYAVLRGLEHKVQMYADEQTHSWPTLIDQRQQIACLCAKDNYVQHEENMTALFHRVHCIYDGLFSEEEDLAASKGSLVFTGVEPESVTMKTLVDYGYRRGPEVWRHMADWLGGRIRATRSPRARELLTRLAPRLIEVCAKTGAPDEAFFTFSEFITNLNAGVTMLSLLLGRPQALTELINMLVLAPPLAKTLSTQPSLIDAMIEPGFASAKAVNKEIIYSPLIGPHADFETAMNIVRRHVHEDQLTVIAAMLRRKNTLGSGKMFSEIANGSISALLPQAVKEIRRQYGNIFGDYAVLAMGKLGGREMTFTSDVDIMLIYDESSSSGELENTGMYNKLTKRLVSALSSVTEAGRLYEVDMALRPSGRSGPLAVSLSMFKNYYRESAWTWEYMALCRARVVAASSEKMKNNLGETIADLFKQKDFLGKLEEDVIDMHRRLSIEKPPYGTWDIKNIAGGLRDIEFIAQYLMLNGDFDNIPNSTVEMLKMPVHGQKLKPRDIEALVSAAQYYQSILQVLAITVTGAFRPETASEQLKHLLAKVFGFETFTEVESQLATHIANVERIFAKVLSR